MRERFLSGLSLFTSSGTLICCALPALFVTLGLGGTVAGFLSNAPWLVQLSQYKKVVFLISGILLGFTWLTVYGPWRRFNQSDADLCDSANGACESAGRFTRITFWISVVIYLVGFFMAFLYLPLMLFMEPL